MINYKNFGKYYSFNKLGDNDNDYLRMYVYYSFSKHFIICLYKNNIYLANYLNINMYDEL